MRPTAHTVGANAERARSHNRQMVLDRVRQAGRIGRAEIARGSGLSTQAISNIIADLLADGLIVEDGRRAGIALVHESHVFGTGLKNPAELGDRHRCHVSVNTTIGALQAELFIRLAD